MTHRHFKYAGWLYTLAFLLALALRLIQLGAMPLNDAEAAPALQAMRIAQGSSPALAPHPFYILSTAVLFFLYGSGTDFLARLIPALVGSLLVFAPLLFDEKRLRPRPGLILAFFIALDPGLTALSRQAASPILAITFFILTVAFFEKNKHSLAGAFAALFLLSGPSIWPGLLGLGITWTIFQVFNFRQSSQPSTDELLEDAPPITSTSSSFRIHPSSLVSFIVTFLVAGTLFFIAHVDLAQRSTPSPHT